MAVLKYKDPTSGDWIDISLNMFVGRDVPIGAICYYAGSSEPDGYLFCNGISLLRTEYPDLFNVIGTTYGAVDSTHFNLPDMRSRFGVGYNVNDTDFNVLGKTGGQKSQNISHTHTINSHSHTVNAHRHNFRIGLGWYFGEAVGETTTENNTGAYKYSNSSWNGWSSAGYNTTTIVNSSTTTSHTSVSAGAKMSTGDTDIASPGTNSVSLTTNANTTATSVNTLPPYIVCNYIIKVNQVAGIVGDIVDNLTSTSSIDALSANQGRILNDTKFDKTGGTISGNVSVNGDISLLNRGNGININGHSGILRHWTNDTQIAANAGTINLRPNGDDNTTGQVTVDVNGNTSIPGYVKGTNGFYSRDSGDVSTPVGNGRLVIKRAVSSEAPNNGVVLEYGDSTSWAGQLYIGDNSTQGIYYNGWSSGYRGKWRRLADEAVTLYSNSSGTTGTVTLSSSAANYTYLEIFYGKAGTDNVYTSSKILNPNGKLCSLSLNYIAASNILQVGGTTVYISGTNITKNKYGIFNLITPSSMEGNLNENSILIYRVLGYI